MCDFVLVSGSESHQLLVSVSLSMAAPGSRSPKMIRAWEYRRGRHGSQLFPAMQREKQIFTSREDGWREPFKLS